MATVAAVRQETPRARTIMLEVPGWPGHTAGMHVDVRLTAEDGYQAQRSYSIASPPGYDGLSLTVERIDDGEVSPYLTEELRVGDSFELRGPIGGYFTWSVGDGGPLLLVAGGSGLVPLMAMIRHRQREDSALDTRLLLSAGSWEDVLYRGELAEVSSRGVVAHYTLTRRWAADWTGWTRRVDDGMLRAVGPHPEERPLVYVCGPTPFVEHVARLLVSLGHEAGRVRTERFGPTGG